MRNRPVIVGMLAVVLGSAVACGGGASAPPASSPAASSGHRIAVTSAAFADGGAIPRRYTCDGADISPPLAFSGVPAGATSLALLVQDSDAPQGPFTHWLVWDIAPRTTALAEGRAPEGAEQGRNDFRRPGYGGPCPPRGDRPHHYVFTVYAADRRPDLTPATATADGLRRALASHTLASGTLSGHYAR
ncbi:YbhB/YbcL family Raf kinase inhibitor-like protein [Streptomyces sp. NPDC004629]|uniref:YbhB/YbcL family Raf kinase inhibitor-like protein n=1 Tax=Streptomyces sp. NPDC004629 TaxID=3364705 RepID=UPI0036CA1CAF